MIDAVRTPIGRYGGALATVRPDDLAAIALRAIVERTGVAPAAIDDVYFGAANQSGEDNRNVARMAVLLAGLAGRGSRRDRQPALRFEPSGDQLGSAGDRVRRRRRHDRRRRRVDDARAVRSAEERRRRSAAAQQLFDTVLGWRMINPKMPAEWTISLGETAENVAERYGITREEQDRFAFESQMKCKAAIERGAFDGEMVPVPLDRSAARGRRATSIRARKRRSKRLAKLKPAFKADGTRYGGQLVGNQRRRRGAPALRGGDRARAWVCGRWRASSPARRAGVAPDVMGLGPIPATRKALERAGMRVDKLDLIEINEAFAAQAIACMRELRARSAKTNVNGGAIALGHPLGASGARIATTLLHEMRRRGGALRAGDDVHRRRPRHRNGFRADGVEGDRYDDDRNDRPRRSCSSAARGATPPTARRTKFAIRRPARSSPTLPKRRASDVDAAVAAARARFDAGKWPTMAASRRAKIVYKMAQLIGERADGTRAAAKCATTARPSAPRKGELSAIVDYFEFYAGAATKNYGETLPPPLADLSRQHGARAGRRRRRDRSVELPAAARVVEGCAGARRRLHDRPQAVARQRR